MADNAKIWFNLAPDVDWRKAYPYIEEVAKAILESPSLAGSLTTTQLADAIYDPQQAHDTKVRKRVFQALKALATRGLAPYCTVGPLEAIGGCLGRRFTWHAPCTPPPTQHCPTCKRPL